MTLGTPVTIFFAWALFVAITPAFPQSPNSVDAIHGYQQIVRKHGSFESFLKLGAAQADNFRRSLLAAGNQEPQAVSLERLVGAFSRRKFPSLDDQAGQYLKPESLDLTRTLKGLPPFGSKTRVHAETIANEYYGPFKGKWYGMWTDFEVNHHWSEIVVCDEPIAFGSEDSENFDHLIVAYQYAWIGDGYGINYVTVSKPEAANDGELNRWHLLGYVEHIKDGDFNSVTARRPHVAVGMKKPGSLCWITAGEVFFEQALNLDQGKAQDYSIFGFSYTTTPSGLKSSGGFYTRYNRQPTNRFQFRSLEVFLDIKRLKNSKGKSPGK